MNKIIIYWIIGLLLISNVFALGIGGKNDKIDPDGIKKVTLFLINDEYKDFTVHLNVFESDGNGISLPEKIKISSDVYIQKFEVELDFNKIEKYPIKIVASEKIKSAGTLVATTNAVYSLPLSRKMKTKQISESSVEEEIANQPQLIQKDAEQNTTQEKEEENITVEEEVSPEGEEKEVEPQNESPIKEQEKKVPYLIYFISFIIFFILVSNFIYARRKSPLQRYIIESRKNGKDDEEISKNLKEKGWSVLLVDSYMKK